MTICQSVQRRVYSAVACLAAVVFFLFGNFIRSPSVVSAQPSEGPRSSQASPAVSADHKLGAITLDPERRRFSVPGVVIRKEPPLEFLAVTKGGFKGYESLLELQTDAVGFNLACILIGLDSEKVKAPKYHFDAAPLQGDRVKLWVSWREKGELRRLPAGQLLKAEAMEAIPEEWIYTASVFGPDGRYQADVDGTLVGFVHDPASVIEHRTGFGLNDYGSVGGSPARCPDVGTEILFIVEAVSDKPSIPAGPATGTAP